jgi:hypothetical protein
MSKMKELSQSVDEICEVCDYKNCEGCVVVVKQDGNEIMVRADTKEILKVIPNKEI